MVGDWGHLGLGLSNCLLGGRFLAAFRRENEILVVMENYLPFIGYYNVICVSIRDPAL